MLTIAQITDLHITNGSQPKDRERNAARLRTVLKSIYAMKPRPAAILATGDLVLAGRTVDELTADIVARPGLGPWTAGYVAVRVLGATDVLLVGDLALRGGARRLGLPDQPRALAAHGARWAPFRSYAGLHLWRAAATPAQTDVSPAPDRTTSS